MGYGILRLAKRPLTANVRAMVRHALRDGVVVPNAIAGAPAPILANNTPTSWTDAKAHLDAARARHTAAFGKLRTTTVQCLDLLITTSAEDLGTWSIDKQDRYFKKAYEFVCVRFGGSCNVLAAAVHRDESTPHMQILIMPIDQDGRFSSSKMIGGPVGMGQMQDDFHAQVAQEFGLKRGEKRTRAKHVPVRALYAAMAAGQDAPAFEKMPEPKPLPLPATMAQRMTGKKPGIDAERARIQQLNDDARAAAIARNDAQRAKLNAQAKAGRSLSPKLIERGAQQFRAGRAMQQLGEKAQERAKEHHAAAVRIQDEVRNATQKATQLQQDAAKAVEATEIDAIRLLDRFSRQLAPSYVAGISGALGIELTAGKGLLDQLRRGGKASTAREAASLLYDYDVDLEASAQKWTERQQQTQRPRG